MFTTHIIIDGWEMHVAENGELEAARSCDAQHFNTFQDALDAGVSAIEKCDLSHLVGKLSVCKMEVDGDE